MTEPDLPAETQPESATPTPELAAPELTSEEQAEAREYGRVGLVCDLLDRGLDFLYLTLMAFLGAPLLVSWLSSYPWFVDNRVLQVAGVFLLTIGLHALVSLPLSFYAGHLVERRFGLSNQTAARWARRYAVRMLLSAVFGMLLFLGLYEIIWHVGRWWWLVAAGAFFAVSVLLGQLAPVLIMPLFYKIELLTEDTLRARLERLAAGTGLNISGVYRIVLSAETSKGNAMLAGLGSTRRVLLGDTVLENFSPAEIDVIFAHEIGHHVHRHIIKLMLWGVVGSLAGFWLCDLGLMSYAQANLGGWRFADVTEAAGLPRDQRHYRGGVFADVNGDGRLDLLLSVVGGGVLCYLNDGHGKFTDASAAAGTTSPFGSMTMALADVDGNGTLDLYVANNRAEDIRDRGQANLQMVNGQLTVPPALQDRLLVVNGQVLEFGEPDQLYLNDGAGHFTPVSWTGGRFRSASGGLLPGPPRDWGLAASFRDINEDGLPDLYVCNDFWTPDRIWLNDGKGRFQEAPRLMLRNMSASSMGVDFADIDRDGRLDFIVVDMLSRDPQLRRRQKLAQMPMGSRIGIFDDRPQFMRNTLFLNRGDGTFAELANYAGVAASEWAWSPVFLDVDLDGYEDLLITTGHARDVQDLDAQAEIAARQHPWAGFANETERQRAFTRELMEHMRLYPKLTSPIVAFRNRGGARFDDVTALWGTDQPGVHHGIALADFDRDGDLDLAVNNLGEGAGIYRNETTAPRVAVRLAGLQPNSQGIGAKVRLRDGAVPLQSQEVIAGGRYLSGSDPLLVFAAGSKSNGMTLEVTWRSGRQSRITNVRPNRLYEVTESQASPVGSGATTAAAVPPTPTAGASSTRLFEDVSQRLQHTHHDDPFDDFAGQPLLPRRLSQLGPGISWFDLDGDGREDLIIGGGKGGQLACYRNDGQGGFQRLNQPPFDRVLPRDQTTVLGWRKSDGKSHLLVGVASFEDDIAAGAVVEELDPGRPAIEAIVKSGATGDASVGPLALADVDGDGDLDLFVGGRVIPGRYPEPASSQLWRGDGHRFQLDAANSAVLERVGLVSGAVWSDLDGDGFPELILACEWAPLKIFRNRRGQLERWVPAVKATNAMAVTLDDLTGWWTGVTTGDLDGDGRLDIVAANWGLNGDCSPSPGHPLKLYYGDWQERGSVDLLEVEWNAQVNADAPRRRLDLLGKYIPLLRERFPSHRRFVEASLAEVLGPDAARFRQVQAATLASLVLFNRGDHFEAVPLPPEAQWAPAFGVNVADFDGDGHEDMFLSQNFFANPPETPRLDAGRGLLLRGNGAGGLVAVPGQQLGLQIYGEQRGSAVADFDGDGRADLVVTQNGAATRLFRNVGAKPGLRVRLAGPPGNPSGIGATIRLKFGARWSAARTLQAGSGCLSQDSAVTVWGLPTVVTEAEVRWPGGRTSTHPVPAAAHEVILTMPASIVP